MTQLQKVFDRVVEQAKKQNKCCSKRMCLYRDDTGNRCFIGALISDKVYDNALEHALGGIRNFTVQRAVRDSGWELESFSPLVDLQKIHDNYPAYEWRAHLDIFAIEHNLKLNWT